MRYKIFIFFISFIICENIYSQHVITPQGQGFIANGVDALNYKLLGFFDKVKQSETKSDEYVGSFFLFDDWKNNSKVQITGKKYTLKNVNLNIQNNQFVSKIGKDSIFTITPKYIDFININDRIFKYQLYNGENKFFEVLFEAKNKLSIFKGYHIRIVPKSNIPMANRPLDEIHRKDKLYVLDGSKFINLKLKKKEVLKLIDKNIQNDIIRYVKEKKLSYKKEKDIVEIFKYYDTL